MAHGFFKTGDIATLGKSRVEILTDSYEGNHKVKYLDGPKKGQTETVPFTILK